MDKIKLTVKATKEDSFVIATLYLNFSVYRLSRMV